MLAPFWFQLTPNKDCEMATKEKHFQNREQVFFPSNQISPLMSMIRNRHLFHYCSNIIVFLIGAIHTWRNSRKNDNLKQWLQNCIFFIISRIWPQSWQVPVTTMNRGRWFKVQKMDCLVSQLIFETDGYLLPKYSWWHITANPTRQWTTRSWEQINCSTDSGGPGLGFYLSLNPKLLQTKTIWLQSKSSY